MRILVLSAAVLVLAGCGSVEYRDTNAAVDARPECTGMGGQPGEPVPEWCERSQEATWSSDDDSEPLDFDGDDDR